MESAAARGDGARLRLEDAILVRAARARVKFFAPDQRRAGQASRASRRGKLHGDNKQIKNEMLFFDLINHCIIDSDAFGVVL